jgi:serine/threonine protein kinase
VRRSSDIYSLGCTLYYAVTGKVPFPGGGTREKLRRHLEEAPLAPTLFTPALDLDLAELIASMMCKRVEGRLGSAAEVVDRLQKWTSTADENTWKQIGQFATAPGERSYERANLADTIVVDANEVDTEEQTPRGRADATAPSLLSSAETRARDWTPRPTVAEHVLPEKPFEVAGLSRGPLLLLAAAIAVALAAVALAIYGV